MRQSNTKITRKNARNSSRKAWKCSLLVLFVMALVSYYQNTKTVFLKLLLTNNNMEDITFEMPTETKITSISSKRRRRLVITRGEQPVARSGAYFYFFDKHPTKRTRDYYYSDIIPFSPPRVVVLLSSSSLEAQNNETTTRITSTRTSTRSVSPMTTTTTEITTTTLDAKAYQFPFEQPYYQQCDFIQKWQTTFYPTCNILHELDIQNDPVSLLTTRGSWRTVWNYQEETKKLIMVVVKLLHLDRNYDEESFHYHQVDSMSMERLSHSRYVIDEYAFCGQSVMTQKANGAARDLVKRNDFLPMDRLRMARDLARGLQDIHSIDSKTSNIATLAHNDINMANMVHDADKNILFNDFNIAILLKMNKTTTKACGYPQRFVGDLWRSPEELRNTSYVDEKADVYSLGNVLFQVMTKHQPWTWLEPGGKIPLEEVVKRKMEGKLPHFPTEFSESKDVAIRVLYEGILACFRHDPKKRPTAHQLAEGFSEVLEWIRKKKKIKRDVNILKKLFQVE